MEENSRYQFNSNDLLFKVFKYRKTIGITVGIAVVVSTVVSFVITPKYRATAVLFPAPATSISKSLIGLNQNNTDRSIFGEDQEVEQLLQVLNSDELKTRITKKYRLIEHYELDSTSKQLKYELNKKFKKNISFGRTQYMAIEISVLDTDPEKASAMANDIAFMIDSVMNRMEKERAVKAYDIVKAQYEIRSQELDLICDSMREIMQHGVYNIAAQSGSLYRVYGQALLKGNSKATAEIEKKLDVLAKYGSQYISLENWIENQSQQLSLLSTKLKEAQVDAEQTLTHFYIVDKAYTPDKKAFPQRSLIILISALSTLVFAVVMIFVMEAIKDFNAREKMMKSPK